MIHTQVGYLSHMPPLRRPEGLAGATTPGFDADAARADLSDVLQSQGKGPCYRGRHREGEPDGLQAGAADGAAVGAGRAAGAVKRSRAGLMFSPALLSGSGDARGCGGIDGGVGGRTAVDDSAELGAVEELAAAGKAMGSEEKLGGKTEAGDEDDVSDEYSVRSSRFWRGGGLSGLRYSWRVACMHDTYVYSIHGYMHNHLESCMHVCRLDEDWGHAEDGSKCSNGLQAVEPYFNIYASPEDH